MLLVVVLGFLVSLIHLRQKPQEVSFRGSVRVKSRHKVGDAFCPAGIVLDRGNEKMEQFVPQRIIEELLHQFKGLLLFWNA